LAFSHEKLEVYQQAVEFVAWSQSPLELLPASHSLRSQLERASASIALNLAEGNARSSKRDRARYWQIALGSAFECAAILDVIVARGLSRIDEVSEGKKILEGVARMLMALLATLGRKVAE
jgi:four helix bundle protein